MNIDDDEITAGGIAVHRQAMVLKRYDNNGGHGNRGVRETESKSKYSEVM